MEPEEPCFSKVLLHLPGNIEQTPDSIDLCLQVQIIRVYIALVNSHPCSDRHYPYPTKDLQKCQKHSSDACTESTD